MQKLKPNPTYLVIEINDGAIAQIRYSEDKDQATNFAVSCIFDNETSYSEEEIRENLKVHGVHHEDEFSWHIEILYATDAITTEGKSVVDPDKFKIPEEQLTALKNNPSVKGIIKYKNGKIWVWCHDHAYDSCGIVNPQLQELLSQLPAGSLAGHDNEVARYNLRRRHGVVI